MILKLSLVLSYQMLLVGIRLVALLISAIGVPFSQMVVSAPKSTNGVGNTVTVKVVFTEGQTA